MAEDNAHLFVAVAVALGIAGYSFYMKNQTELIEGFKTFVKTICIIILIGSILFIGVYFLVKRIKKYNQEKDFFLHEMERLVRSPDKETYYEFKNLCINNLKLVKKYSDEIEQNEIAFKKAIKEAELKQKEIEKEEELEEISVEESSKDIYELLDFFKKKKSNDVIPRWALEMSPEDIKEAKELYADYVDDIQTQKKEKKEVIEFILENKGYPSDFHKLSSTKQNLYHKYVNMDEIQLWKDLGSRVKDTFFVASEVKPDERERLLRKGYRMIPCNDPKTGKLGLNVIIWNDPKKESDHHFCMKHLFAKYFNGQVEVLINNMRVDVVIGKIFLEIETGKNKDLQVQKKWQEIAKYTTAWYFICPRAKVAKYRALLPKGHILQMRQAYLKLKSLTAL